MIKSVLYSIIVLIITAMTSCSDYRNAIPGNSIALISLDVRRISEINDANNEHNVFGKILGMEDISDCGIDFDERIYLFEDKDGSLGLVACIDDADKMGSWLNKQAQNGRCTKVSEKKGYKFSVLNDNFVAGFSGRAIVIMGPAVGAAQKKLQSKIIRNLSANSDRSIVKTKIYERLSSMDSPVNMVVRGHVLPEKLVSVFSFGVQSKASPEDILIAASATIHDKSLSIVGETFSFDETINMAIKSSLASYNPIAGDYVDSVSLDNVMTILSGVNGENYLNLLRNNQTFRAMLIGLNTALDIDMMLKSIDGDILMSIPAFRDSNVDFTLLASTKDTNWLADVAYWKDTAPSGSRIEEIRPRNFCYTNMDWKMYFGINSKEQLYVSTIVPELPMITGRKLPEKIKKEVIGRRACAILSIKSLLAQKPEARIIADLMASVFGDVDVIMYSMK